MTNHAVPTAIRIATGKAGEAKSHKVEVSYPDGTSASFGGKVAARATHVLVTLDREAQEGDSEWFKTNRAGQWGWWCKGTLATCQKGLADIERWGSSSVSATHIVAIEVPES